MTTKSDQTEVMSFRADPEMAKRVEAFIEREKERTGATLTRAQILEMAVTRFLNAEEEKGKKKS